jgi:FkbM family methyltransferase
MTLLKRVLPSLRRDWRFLGVKELSLRNKLALISAKYVFRLPGLAGLAQSRAFSVHGRRFRVASAMDLSHLQYVILDVREVVEAASLRKNSNVTVVDIGAHDGETAVAFDLFLPDAVIYSFEPNPECYQRALVNTAGRRVRLFNVGLSDHTGLETFVADPGWDAKSTFDLAGHSAASGRRLPVARGDELIDLSRIDLLKIDVEGYEGHVLRGLDGILDRVDHLAIEWSLGRAKDSSFRDLAEILSRHNFDLVRTSAPSYDEDGRTQITIEMYFRRAIPSPYAERGSAQRISSLSGQQIPSSSGGRQGGDSRRR